MAMVMLNGVLMGAVEASVPALDRALTHGLGLYETLKLIHGVPAFFDEHLTRLENGLMQIGVEAPFDRPGLADQIVRLSEATDVRDGACRVLVTAGPPEGRPTLLVQTEVRPTPTRPLTLISYRTLRAAAALKSNSFIASEVAQRAAHAAGADDALFVDEEWRIYEATTANVFVVRGGVLTTAPTNGAILPGVIRAKLLQLAESAGLQAGEWHTAVTSLGSDDVVLLTSSVRGIVPVASVDGRRLRQDEALLGRLRGLLGDAEQQSAAGLRAQLA
jgi:branched-subunit amino acid aminotransferase/4-amino-4-deoxychorismate lyase